MLTPNEIERFSMMLDPQMKQLEERIMADIVRRIRINGEITRAADWQINRMQQLGVSVKTVQDEIQHALGLSDEDMEKLYSDIAERGYARDSKLYEATGKHRIPFEENAELQQLISSVANQTNETMQNITQSLGFAVRQPDGRIGWSPLAQYYQKTLDGAMLDIASGAFDYNTVLKRVVSEMTNSGLRTIDYATGHKNRVDVAARRALMTGMSQITAKINSDNMEALDTEYVEVSWHGGARPSHQEWQGKVYRWRRGGNTGAAVPVGNSPRQQAKQVQKVQYMAADGLTNGAESGIIKEKYIRDCEDYNQLQEYLENKYGIELDNNVKELDFATVKDSLYGVETVIKDYPQLGENLKKVKISRSGVMSCDGNTITFNPVYFKNSDKIVAECKEQSESRYWIKNSSPSSLGVHEAAHAVEQLLINANPAYEYDFMKTFAWNDCTEAKSIVTQAINEIKKTPFGKGKKKDDLVAAISRYAKKTDSETMAEAFADVFANEEQANPLSIRIREITKERYSKYLKGAG